jgi:putative ATPase
VAVAASLAVERIGLPESQIILSQAASYVACAPKSNSAVNAIFKAKAEVEKSGNLQIPPYLKDAHYNSAEKLGHGIGYKYAHDFPFHFVDQQYLPDEIKNESFYELSDNGYESKLKKWFEMIGKKNYHKEPKK